MTFIRILAGSLAAAALAAAPAAAAAQVSAPGGFRNVLPGKQGETVNAPEFAASQATGNPPRSFTTQLGLYTGLVGASPRLRPADLDRYFKSEAFGVPAGQVASTVTPRPGADRARQGARRPARVR